MLILFFSIIATKTQAQQIFDGNIKNNSLAISPTENIALASNSDVNFVSVYNLKSRKLIKKIPGFISPRNIIFSPDGMKFYITDSSTGFLTVLETKNFKIIEKYAVGFGAFGSAISNNGQEIYINNEATNTVTVLFLSSLLLLVLILFPRKEGAPSLSVV